MYIRQHKKIAMASLRAQGVYRDYSALDGKDGDINLLLKFIVAFDENNYEVQRITTADKRTTHWIPQVQ